MPTAPPWLRLARGIAALAVVAGLAAPGVPRAALGEEPAATPPAGLPGGDPADPASASTVRWYELLRQGRKIGWAKVAWSPSTFEGRPSVHDRTESVTRSVRDMAGQRDTFEMRSVINIERGADGSLWSQELVVEEAGRRSVETLRWNGKAYLHSSVVDGQTVTRVVPLDAPVSTDVEAFLSQRAREGSLAPGEQLVLRELDVEGRRARISHVEVLGSEETPGEAGPVATVKVLLRHPETGSESWLWLDREGAFVRSESDTGMLQRRVSEEAALRMPTRPPSFSITVASRPPLERVMSADRLQVEVELADDPARKLPEFPVSPWSRAGAPRRDAAGHWVIPATLTAYDDPLARAPLPLAPEGFERDLEPTALMPCGHPDLVRTAREIVGDAADARTATARLARWVCDELRKQSLDVAQGSALQILEERRGDCSEHALLFVALCRAAGIPARRCSGYVNIGPMWGAHAWAEVWTGRWIGADPTTGEIGCGARYLFFGYSDDPDSFPGVVSARVDGRIGIRALEVEEDGVAWPLDPVDGEAVIEGEEPQRWLVHPASGLELHGIPAGWTAAFAGGQLHVRGPKFLATLSAQADQGERLRMGPGAQRSFAGVPAFPIARGPGRAWLVHSRRRFVRIEVLRSDEETLALFERMVAPSVSESVMPRATAGVDPGPSGERFVAAWALDSEATLEHQASVLLRGVTGAVRAAMRTRLEALVARLSARITVRADATYALEATLTRGGDDVTRVERAGAWARRDAQIELAPPEDAGLPRLQGRLLAPDRLELSIEDWVLVFARR